MKLMIVGMNPSNTPTLKGKVSPTFKKIEEWMDYCEIGYFSFINTFDHPSNTPSMKEVDTFRIFHLTRGYDKIIALGAFASKVLSKCNVDHFQMPHPSPRNRLLNDKNLEKELLKKCKKYLKG